MDPSCQPVAVPQVDAPDDDEVIIGARRRLP
jgi:hypothetical protein